MFYCLYYCVYYQNEEMVDFLLVLILDQNLATKESKELINMKLQGKMTMKGTKKKIKDNDDENE